MIFRVKIGYFYLIINVNQLILYTNVKISEIMKIRSL